MASHPKNDLHPILNAMRADPAEIVRRQRIAEDELHAAEHAEGSYKVSAIYTEEDRQETIARAKDILRPVNLSDVKMPQVLIVRLAPETNENLPENMQKYPSGLEFGKTYILLGEMAQAPGHVVVCDSTTGKIFSGFHAERFEVVPVHEA